ncbi:MAG: cadherin domain-containing protein, partial [Acidimicrobiaceae bacterium]|nr:cadherin domain-containing protein [Acidimicrobiaceae bacterium]
MRGSRSGLRLALALALVAALLQPAAPAQAQTSTAATVTSMAITSIAESTSIHSGKGTYVAGEEITATVTFSKPVHVSGSLLLLLQIGDNERRAVYSDGTGSDTLTFDYHVAADDTDSDGISIGANKLTLPDQVATVKDSSNVDADLSYVGLPADEDHKVDGSLVWMSELTVSVVPGGRFVGCLNSDTHIADCTSALSDSNFRFRRSFSVEKVTRKTNQDAELTLRFNPSQDDAEVFRTGLGLLTLKVDGTAVALADATRNGDDVVVNVPSLTGKSWTENQRVTLSLGDVTVPTVESVKVTSTSPEGQGGRYLNGDKITATVTFSEPAHVTGEPELELQIGGNARKAVYAGGSRTSKLTFDYTVGDGDEDTDGISIGADKLTLPSGSTPAAAIADGWNDADLDHAALGAQAAHQVWGHTQPDPPVAQTVEQHWPLIPKNGNQPQVTAGQSFRLLFVADVFERPHPTGIAFYNGHVQRAAKKIPSLVPFYDQFRAVVSTQTVHARDNTATAPAGTSYTEDEGVPIYGIDGQKIADDYADFYDGSWDSTDLRVETGKRHRIARPGNLVGIWTGSTRQGTRHPQRYLGGRALTNGETIWLPVTGDGTLAGVPRDRQNGGAFLALSPVLTVAGVWSANLTVDEAGDLHGCDETNSALTNCSIAMTDRDFTYGQTDYTFSALYWDDRADKVVLKMGTSFGSASYTAIKSFLGRLTLNVGGEALAFSAATAESDRFTWPLADPSWADGDTVALSLAESPATVAITSRVPSNQDGHYKIGDKITATVTFNQNVTVEGSPRLALSIGGNERQAVYASASGRSLAFDYTVAPGDADADGISVGANKLTLNGGKLLKASSEAVSTAHGALAQQNGHKVDAVKPTAAFPTTGKPRVGRTWTIRLADSGAGVKKYGAIAVDATAGTAGDCDTAAEITAGGGTVASEATPAASKNFDYTVPEGSDAKLVCVYVADAAGNPVGALGATAIAVAPKVSSVAVTSSVPGGQDGHYRIGDVIEATATFDGDVIVTGTPTLTIKMGTADRAASCAAHATDETKLVCTYTVADGDADTDGIEIEQDKLAVSSSPAATIRDAADTDAVLDHAAVAASVSHKVDGVAPAVSAVEFLDTNVWLRPGDPGDSVKVRVTFSEAATVTGAPELTLRIGANERTAAYASGSGTTELRFAYAVTTADTDTDGVTIAQNSLTLPTGASITDAVGNDAKVAHAAVAVEQGQETRVDGGPPTVVSVAITSSAPAAGQPDSGQNGHYKNGDKITATVTFSEPVIVAGQPELELQIGDRGRAAVYAGGSGTPKLRFDYTVGGSDADADGISIGADKLTLPSSPAATIKDASGNDADRRHSALAAQTAYKVDGVVPTVASVKVVSRPRSGGTYVVGELIDVRVIFSEKVWFGGGKYPVAFLNVGGSNKKLGYNNTVDTDPGTGLAGTELRLLYGVKSGDSDSNGVSIPANLESGGWIVDAAGNNAIRTFAAVPDLPGHKVQAAPPAAPSGVVTLRGNGKVTLVWDNPGDPTITKYQRRARASRQPNWPSWLDINRSGPSTTETSWEGLNSEAHDFQVRAVNGNGEGAIAEVSGVTPVYGPPVYLSTATPSVAENQTAVMTVVAKNADQDAVYRILSGTRGGADGSKFTINSTTGVLAFKTAPDYENPTDALSADPANAAGNNEYIVIVRADLQVNVFQTITVTVTNADEPGTVAISPVEPVAGEQLTARLTGDPDGLTDSDNNPYPRSWQWARADAKDGRYTDIPDATSAAYTPVAADAGKWLRATATYTDGQGAKKTAGAVTASTVAASVTNQSPVFDPKTAARSVDENSPPGTAVGLPVAAAQDDDSGDTLTYTMTGPDAEHFSFNAATLQITTKSALDHESKSAYSVAVNVSDSKTADGLPSTGIDDTIEVTITVTDVDEAGTVAFDPARPFLGQAITAGVVDPDEPVSGVTWQWAATEDAPSVENRSFDDISGATSAGYTPVAGDVGKWLRATAVYTDSFGASKTAAAVTADAVLAPPAAPAGVVALIGNRKVTLVWDNPEDPTISRYQRGLRLTSGSGEPGVYLNVHNSGPDTTTASIGSLNNGTSYTVYLRAVNAAGPGPATQIAATPKASSPIVFYSPATRSVAENTTAVMTVRAGNADVDASYVVTGGADKDSFVIDNTTGVLAFKTAPDYENPTDALSESPGPANAAGNNEYILVVTAIWQTEQIKQTITVTVTNVDDPGVVTITPVEPVAGEELTAGLVDQDAPVEDVIWQWARADAKDGSYTDISGATSTAYTPVAADDGGKWLRATAAYADGLGAKKTAGAVTASSVAASVTNQPPAFDPKTAARSVDENSPPGTAVGAPVAATDDDSGDTLTYSMTGPDAGSFSFNTATAQITTKSALDHEGKSEYSVTVSVSDSKTADGLPSTLIDDTIEVAITVTDVDEAGTVSFTARPLLSRQITARVVDPDVPVEDVTWQWAATADAPSVESRTFVEISGATSAGYTPVAGDVGKWLRATAVYTDSFGASKTAAAVTGAAVLAPPAAPTGVNALPGDAKVTLRWDNPRDGTITRYERGLRRSASAGVPQYLNVHNSGPGTTTVTVEGLVNATSYTFYLRAVNAAGPGPPTLVAATPTATPSFEFRSPATPSVHENTTAVITLRAGNADIDAGATTYSITGGADQTAFTLDNTSGVLAFKTAPDYENPTDALSADPANAAINNQYIVVVEAANGQQTTSQTITVTVTNIDEPGTVSFDSTAPKEGTALAATLTDPDGNLSGLTWSWERSADQTTWEAATGSVTSTGATSAYTPDAADGDKQLRATAAYTDGHASGKSASAVTTAAVTAAAPPSCAGSVATPSGSSEGLVADCEALLAAEGGLAGSGSLDWATTTAIADWAGVTLAGDRVAELDLSEMSLTGTIPAGLGGLSTLEYLDLSGNELAGEIPAELGGLSALW